MLGNAWEWVSDEFKEKGRETKYVLRGGSYIDTADGKHNHKVTVTTRYVKTGNCVVPEPSPMEIYIFWQV